MSWVAIDIECSRAPKHMPWTVGSYLCSVGIERQDGTSTVWFFNPNDRPHEELLSEIQQEIDKVDFLVGHNIKFDLNWLKWIGLNVKDKPIWCTMLADYLINGQRKLEYSLNAVASRYNLGHKLDAMAMYWQAGYETDEIPLDIHEEYLKMDVHLTHEVFKRQLPLIERANLGKITELSFRITQILSDMEVSGAAFDKDGAITYCNEARSQVRNMDNQLVKLAGIDFTPSSSSQLSAVLFGGSLKKELRELVARQLKSGKYKITTRKAKVDIPVKGLGFKVPEGCLSKKTGLPSVDKNTIDLLKAKDKRSESFLNVLREQRKLQKVVSTIAGSSDENEKGLVAAVGKDGRLHPSFNQCVTRTGRLSSSDPNGQNLSRKGTSPIKTFFKSQKGVIVNLDLAQIEWRIAAELSKDPVMIHELNEGLDIHTDNAIRFLDAGKYERGSEEFKQVRTIAKTISFRLLYGGSAEGFFRDQRMPDYSLKRWREIVNAFYQKYQGLKRWQDANIQTASARGYIRNPSGRVLTFDEEVKYGIESVDVKQVKNYPVQSGSTDVMYLCMVKILEKIQASGINPLLILQVHDSLVFDCTIEEAETLCRIGIETFKSLPALAKEYFGWDIVVPLLGDCEVGYDYGNTKGFKEEEMDKIFKDLPAFLS
jgi:DNA polymerase-1